MYKLNQNLKRQKMQKRNPLAVVGLSIITLGIYDLYWLAKTKNELNKHVRTKVPSIWLLIIPVIVAFVAYVLAFIGLASTGATTSSTNGFGSSTAYAPVPEHTAIIAVIGFIVAFISIFALAIIAIIWFFKFSKAINEYTDGKMSTAVCFLVLYLIHLIGVALIQDTFNDMLDAGVAPGVGQPIMPVSTGVAPGQTAYQQVLPVQPVVQQPTPLSMPPVQPASQPIVPPLVVPDAVPPEPSVSPVQPPSDTNTNSDTPIPPVQ
jgi:hypothetical protein